MKNIIRVVVSFILFVFIAYFLWPRGEKDKSILNRVSEFKISTGKSDNKESYTTREKFILNVINKKKEELYREGDKEEFIDEIKYLEKLIEMSRGFKDIKDRVSFLRQALDEKNFTKEQICILLNVIRFLEPSFEKKEIFIALIERLAGISPKLGAVYAMVVDNPWIRVEALGAVAEQWAKISPEDALEWSNILSLEEIQYVQNKIFEVWARENISGLANWIKNYAGFLKDSNIMEYAINSFVAVRGEKEPVECINWALSLSEEKIKQDIIRKVMDSIIARSPLTAFEIYSRYNEQIPVLNEEDIRAKICAELIRVDPEKALLMAMKISDLIGKARILEAIENLAVVRPDKAFEFFSSLERGNGIRKAIAPYIAGIVAVTNIDNAWKILAEVGPYETLGWARLWEIYDKDFDDNRKYEEGFRLMIKTWARIYPENAVMWLVKFMDNLIGREEILGEAITAWCYSDITSTLNFVEKLSGRFRSVAVGKVVEFLSESDVPEAFEYLHKFAPQSEEDKEMKKEKMSYLCMRFLTDYPSLVADFLIKEEIELTSSDLACMIEAWSKISPEEASVWINNFVSGDSRKECIRALVKNWYIIDPLKLNRWITGLEDRDERIFAFNVVEELKSQFR